MYFIEVILNLFVSFFYSFSFYAIGHLVLNWFRIEGSDYFDVAFRFALGLMLTGLLLQLLAFGFYINGYTIAIIHALMVVSNLWIIRGASLKPDYPSTVFVHAFSGLPGKFKDVFFWCYLITWLPIFYYALLPGTRMDELYYHQLVPKRIWEDGGLMFYLHPLEAAMPSQFIYQTTQVLSLAIRLPGVQQCLSFIVLLIFHWTIYKLFLNNEIKSSWRFMMLAIYNLGMFRLVYTTAGGHHFSDMVSFFGLFGILTLEKFKDKDSLKYHLLFLGICLAGMVGTKLSLVPLALILFFVLLLKIIRRDGFLLTDVLPIILPISVLCFPILTWTYLKTGSPFGVAFSTFFSTHVFEGDMDVGVLFSRNQLISFQSIVRDIQVAMLHYSFTPFLAMGGLFLLNIQPALKKLVYFVAVSYLCILFYFNLFYHPRFWGNIPFLFFVLVVMHIAQKSNKFFQKEKWSRITMLLHIPYFLLSYYYIYNLKPVPVDKHTTDLFNRNYLPMHEDFEKLDSLLPPEACLYAEDLRMDLFHCPRKIYLSQYDIKPCTDLYFLASLKMGDKRFMFNNILYTADSLVYQNDNAIWKTFRTPGRISQTSPIYVYRLKRINR